MRDKYRKLNGMMELLQDEFIQEALEEEQKKRYGEPFWRYVVAAACVCLVVGSFGWFLYHHMDSSHVSQGDVLGKYKIPKIQYENDENSYADLEKILCDFRAGDGGGSENCGWLIIKSLQDVASKNPTRNHVGGIKELPVFQNEEGLWSDYHEWESLAEMEIYFSQPCFEEKRDYAYDGICSNSWNSCFQLDQTKDATEQLLEYTFYRINYAIYEEGDRETGWYRVMTPPAGTGKMYPILSVEQAKQKLRRGEFFSNSPYDKDVAGTAKILSVELEYQTEEYQTYIQPFYKFVITDESWNLSQIMDCENWEDYMSVSEVYVPAVQDKYLKIKKGASLRVN